MSIFLTYHLPTEKINYLNLENSAMLSSKTSSNFKPCGTEMEILENYIEKSAGYFMKNMPITIFSEADLMMKQIE